MSRPLPEELAIELGLDEPDDETSLRQRVATQLGVDPSHLPAFELKKRSIDARRGRVRFRLLFGLSSGATPEPSGPMPRDVEKPARVLIVGDGPAGLFCAYELSRWGIGATIVDRGKLVQPRRRDLKGLNRHGVVDPDSNYCFGEGGAGTYSDGKLYTRSHKRGNVRDVIEILALHGAPPAILVDARPHIGSNRLPKVVSAIRERLEGVGVTFRFGARVVELLIERRGGRRRAAGVRFEDGSELAAEFVVLATGHSASDVFELLARQGVRLEPKPFAIGVRIEHPQPLINELQYGKHSGHPKLPNAYYRLASEVDGRGVFSFCMCPGGFVVPAATEPGTVVVNGMSLSKRDSPFANSGLVVSIEPEDWGFVSGENPMGGLELQRRIERASFEAGGGGLKAPATRATDFLRGKSSSTLPKASYIPGLTPSDVCAVLDVAGLELGSRLRRALGDFERTLRGYLTDEAVLIGVESRTSSPVRVPRDEVRLESPDLERLFPCGEGAGFAGGIVSAALDGIRVARAITVKLRGT